MQVQVTSRFLLVQSFEITNHGEGGNEGADREGEQQEKQPIMGMAVMASE